MHNGSKPGVRSKRHTCTERSTFSTRAASANAAPIARWRRRDAVGRRALPTTHEKKLATFSLPENQNLCHGGFVGRAAPNGKRDEARRSERRARKKTTAKLLIFHEIAKSTISQGNNFKELQAHRRNVFVSQAKFSLRLQQNKGIGDVVICEFRTGLRPTPIDEMGDICRPHRHGRACPGHPRRPMAPQSPILSAPCRLSILAACKPDYVDGRA